VLESKKSNSSQRPEQNHEDNSKNRNLHVDGDILDEDCPFYGI
jgi:hypothetical protein